MENDQFFLSSPVAPRQAATPAFNGNKAATPLTLSKDEPEEQRYSSVTSHHSVKDLNDTVTLKVKITGRETVDGQTKSTVICFDDKSLITYPSNWNISKSQPPCILRFTFSFVVSMLIKLFQFSSSTMVP